MITSLAPETYRLGTLNDLFKANLMKLEFRNLPLIRVASRFSLVNPLPLSVRFCMDLAEKLKDSFPEVVELPAIEWTPGTVDGFRISNKTGPGGVRYLDPEKNLSVDIQESMVSVVWAGDGVLGYPGYQDGIRPSLAMVMRGILDLAGEGYVLPAIANMAYTNFLRSTAGHKSETILQYIAAFGSPLLGEEGVFHSLDFALRNKEGVDYRITTATAGNQEDPAYTFTSSAGKLIENRGDPLADLDLVHVTLVRTFNSLLTDKANSEWEKL